MSNQLPGYYLFVEHYKKVDLDNKQASAVSGLKRAVANACAVRLSYAFNHISGHQIPAKPPGVYGNVWSGLKGNYILGSKGFANFLTKHYFKPIINKPSVHQKDFTDRRGIIFFDVRGWSDANGHIALWDGKKGWRGEYFGKAKNVWFWEMASGPGAFISPML